jgi:hypothetical protein
MSSAEVWSALSLRGKQEFIVQWSEAPMSKEGVSGVVVPKACSPVPGGDGL